MALASTQPVIETQLVRRADKPYHLHEPTVEIWKPQPPGQGLSRPVQGLLYLYLYLLHMEYSLIVGTSILDFTVETVLDDL